MPAALGGEPVRRTPFPNWPIADAREEQALTGVVRSGKWGRGGGTQVERFESKYAGADRRETLPRHRERHQRAVHRDVRARHRARRRSDRPALHVRRDHQRRAAATRASSLRRHRSRDVPDRCAQDRRGHHAAHAPDRPGASRRRRSRSRHDARRRARPRHPGAGGRVSVAPRRVEGPQGRHVRPRRLLQFPGEQEPERRRRRRADHRRPGLPGDLLHVPQQQPRPQEYRQPHLHLPRRRRQPAPDGVPGGDPARADDTARRAGDDARPERRVPDVDAEGDSRHHAGEDVRRAARGTRITSTCCATTSRDSPACRRRRS